MGPFFIRAALLLLGGIIAASGMILAKKPDAKELLAKITPYQGFVGVGLLGYGVYDLITSHELLTFALHFKPVLFSLMMLGWFVGAIVLGFILGMPQIAKWIPGESDAEQKVMNIQQKLLPLQAIFGLIALGAGVMMLLFALKITSWGFGAMMG